MLRNSMLGTWGLSNIYRICEVAGHCRSGGRGLRFSTTALHGYTRARAVLFVCARSCPGTPDATDTVWTVVDLGPGPDGREKLATMG